MRRVILAVALISAVAVASGGGRAQAAPTCFGFPATIVQTGGTVTGTGGADVIVAINADAVYGYGGADRICTASEVGGVSTYVDAGSGNDLVDACESAGLLPIPYQCAQEIRGGSGNDELIDGNRVYGDSGSDKLVDPAYGYGGAGADLFVLNFVTGTELCDGGSGDDEITGPGACASLVSVP